MEDGKSAVSMLEGDGNLLAAAEHIAKALGSKKKLTNEIRKAFADLGSQLSSMSMNDDNNTDEKSLNEVEMRLGVVQEKILSWESDRSMIWDCGQEEVEGYLKAVDEAQKLAKELETSVSEGSDNTKYLRMVHDVIHTAMARLEDEFKYMLVQNRQPFEPEHMSFRSCEDDVLDEGSRTSFEEDPSVDMNHRDSSSTGRYSEDYSIDLINRDVIPDLKYIANTMFTSSYDHECTQAYICVRKDGLDECLFILEMEKLSIEDMLKMEWGSLNSKIKRWVRAMKIFVRVYLRSEKRLSDQIFGELGSSVISDCFLEASKVSMMQLLNFGEAIVAIGPHRPEKLFRILDMYEVLADLIPDIDVLYSEEVGSFVKTECREILTRLGDTARATFSEFVNAIATNVSSTPFAAGTIHHLTRYVMNYIRALAGYSDTLNALLKDHNKEGPIAISLEDSPVAIELENPTEDLGFVLSPMAIHLHNVSSVLESNLEDKSKLYKDVSLQHFFLMNNIHYMSQKVKNSELRSIFGDEWIRKHNWKFQEHERNYERATWNPLLSLLHDDGLYNHSLHSRSISKTLLKERFRTFYVAFDEVYKAQTAWLIVDKQLRDDLQISISLKVIQAYRMFVGRHDNDISEKYIKYNANDLENYLMDLFEGSQKSLHYLHRR